VLTHTFPAFTAQLVANNPLMGGNGQAARKTELFLQSNLTKLIRVPRFRGPLKFIPMAVHFSFNIRNITSKCNMIALKNSLVANTQKRRFAKNNTYFRANISANNVARKRIRLRNDGTR